MNKIYDDNGISLYLIRYGLKTRAGITAKKKKKEKKKIFKPLSISRLLIF